MIDESNAKSGVRVTYENGDICSTSNLRYKLTIEIRCN
jgi:hypothetical protein